MLNFTVAQTKQKRSGSASLRLVRGSADSSGSLIMLILSWLWVTPSRVVGLCPKATCSIPIWRGSPLPHLSSSLLLTPSRCLARWKELLVSLPLPISSRLTSSDKLTILVILPAARWCVAWKSATRPMLKPATLCKLANTTLMDISAWLAANNEIFGLRDDICCWCFW